MSSRIWDYWAKRYERLWVQRVSLGPTRRCILEELKHRRCVGQDAIVVDMGCGTGQLLREIRKQWGDAPMLSGVDFSQEMITVAIHANGGIEYTCCDILAYTGEPNGVDLILCTHSFPYYPDKKAALEKFSALLKPGGLLFLAQACENNLYDRAVMAFVKLTAGQAKYLSRQNIYKLVSGIFASVDVMSVPTSFYMPSIHLFVCVKGAAHEHPVDKA